jgi:hypothetical protein
MIETAAGNVNLSRELFWDIHEKEIEMPLLLDAFHYKNCPLNDELQYAGRSTNHLSKQQSAIQPLRGWLGHCTVSPRVSPGAIHIQALQAFPQKQQTHPRTPAGYNLNSPG